ncbi:MAG: TrmB family transcriptional regulator [Nocardioidaceae bacterium]
MAPSLEPRIEPRADLNDLMSLGLTRYEAGCYLALIGRAEATPAEVARLAKTPRQRAYDVLAGLAERGVVTAVPGRHVRYRAKHPREVAERLIAAKRRAAEQLAHTGDALAERLVPEYLEGESRADPLDYVEVLRNPTYAVERIQQLWEGADDQILALVGPPYLAPPPPEEATLPSVRENRALYAATLLDDPPMSALLQRYAALGEEVRLAAKLPMKLTVIDGCTVAFNLPDPVREDTSVTTLIVQHAQLAGTLRIAFEALWAQAQPLEVALSERGSEPA